MNTVIDSIRFILPLLYAFTVWYYYQAFFTGRPGYETRKRFFLYFTIGLHFSYLLLRTVEFNHPPITTIFEIMTVIAFCITTAYVYLEMRTKIHGTGTFILTLAFIFQLISSLFIKNMLEVKTVLRSNLLGFHVTSALLGFTAFALSAMYGLLYLMLYHDIKVNRFGVIYKRLPNLEILESLSFRSTIFGFSLLTIAILIGFIWLPRAFQQFSYTDPKLVGTLFTWGLYGLGLIAKRIGGFQGRRLVILEIFGFVLALFSMSVINIFFSEFHKFY